jgi:hypothetical protein
MKDQPLRPREMTVLHFIVWANAMPLAAEKRAPVSE